MIRVFASLGQCVSVPVWLDGSGVYLDTMLDTLPLIAIDSEITENQKQGLVDSLKKF